MKFEIPSKTFLLGEYAVLEGTPGFVITTTPSFVMNATITHNPISSPLIHQQHPAARFYQKYQTLLQQVEIEWFDPHQESGGFGASTAYFLGLFLIVQTLQQKSFDIFHAPSRIQLLTEYWNCCDHKPSGIDLIAQACGGIAYFDRTQNQLKKLFWPHENLSFFIIKTHEKIATHQHLQQLEKRDFSQLNTMINSCDYLSQSSLIQSIHDYQKELERLKLVCENTLHLLDEIHQNPMILAAKGCGALGADVILILLEKKNKAAVRTWIESLRLNMVADEIQIAYHPLHQL